MRRIQEFTHTPFWRWAFVPARVAMVVLATVLVSVCFTSRGGFVSSHPSTTNSRGEAPPWMRAGPSLAGTWLHWRQYEYYYNPDSPDPTIGKLLLADDWEHIGPDNVPTLVTVQTRLCQRT